MDLFLAAVSLICIIGWWLSRKRNSHLRNRHREEIEEAEKRHQDELSETERRFKRDIWTVEGERDKLSNRLARLEKYQSIADAEDRAHEMVNHAERESERILSSAKYEASQIQEEVKRLRSIGNTDLREKKEKADAILNSATIEAGRIVEIAEKRAEEIAGDAYSALKDAALFERTIKAMKNKIEGYGDAYIIPNASILDTLADDFGYTQAGEELKKSRDRSRYMVKNGTAGKCDYVEAGRKETAINFVVDAFNGKVDSILSRIKMDNFGILKQEVIDASTLVNFNGRAFRNAQITDEYLNSRLEELRWGVSVVELREKEKEEQRRIKEQIREEEKARRDYERAIKEAEKEEEALKKAMEKIQREVEKATDEQRSKYEMQLQELEQKLKDAEERNKRALSMAQQTKTGHVYVISNVGSFGEDIYKIGLTRRLDPLDRVKELGDASVPFEFDVHAMILNEDAPALEHALHKKFMLAQVNKINPRKEFFKLPLNELRSELEALGIEVKWTMAAEAKEWRESQAIERQLIQSQENKEKWMAWQEKTDAVVDEELIKE